MASNRSPSREPRNPLIARLQGTLQNIHSNPSPHVRQPESCKKRASVAVVLRVRPTHPHQGHYEPSLRLEETGSVSSTLEKFFAQDWVQHGEPEVLFIKRAVRQGDRWTGHTAFPGGRREPDDRNDEMTSVRETREEVGIALDAEHCLLVGNLPERVITAHWGKIPIMVMCPFVYLLLRHDMPPPSLQPTEVHSTHWVTLRSLLSADLRTYARADITDRLKPQRGPIAKYIIRSAIGQLVFQATFLKPSESLYSNVPPPATSHASSSRYSQAWLQRLIKVLTSFSTSLFSTMTFSTSASQSQYHQPLLLWGLTLGVVCDLLNDLDPVATRSLWMWPTFSHWDIRLVVWLLTWNIRRRKGRASPGAISPGNYNVSTSKTSENPSSESRNENEASGGVVKIDAIDNTSFTTTSTNTDSDEKNGPPLSTSESPRQPSRRLQTHVGLPSAEILDEYFKRMYKGVIVALVIRANVIAAVTAAVMMWRKRRGRV